MELLLTILGLHTGTLTCLASLAFLPEASPSPCLGTFPGQSLHRVVITYATSCSLDEGLLKTREGMLLPNDIHFSAPLADQVGSTENLWRLDD